MEEDIHQLWISWVMKKTNDTDIFTPNTLPDALIHGEVLLVSRKPTLGNTRGVFPRVWLPGNIIAQRLQVENKHHWIKYNYCFQVNRLSFKQVCGSFED